MKKLYTSRAYKKRQKARMRRVLRNKKKRNNRKQTQRIIYTTNKAIISKPIVDAPEDFRLLYNTEECMNFFKDIRSKRYRARHKSREFVEMSLLNVKKIDYSTISILTAINDDFKFKNISFRGNFPKEEEPKNYLIDSGFLNSMYDKDGKRFPQAKKSEILFFEKGAQIFSKNDNKRISQVVQNISKHLTGVKAHNPPLRTILLEIFANSIEWGQTHNKQWLLGVKYDDEKVILTVTDVGKGIIRTLFKRFGQKFFDIFKSNSDTLIGAFEKQYGSASKKTNRNKGLPSIKKGFDDGVINELKVITNNVILHFDKTSETRTVKKGISWFRGTFYRCVITKECLPN